MKNKKVAFLVSVLITGIIIAFAIFFSRTQLGQTIFLILFAISAIIMACIASVAVIRSLFFIGASLSFVIFISQEYCSLPDTLRTADESLIVLVGLGIIYIIFIFSKSLYKEIAGNSKNKKKGVLDVLTEINRGELSLRILLAYLLFVVLLLIQIFKVITPIFSNLCVFQ